MDTSKYKNLFLQEAREHLSGIEKGLGSLDEDPGGEDVKATVDNLFRHYHTLKGMSASMGYDPIQRFSHAQEDLLDRVRSGGLPVSGGLTAVLFECLDVLTGLVDDVEEDRAFGADITPYLEKITAAAEAAETDGARPEAAAPPSPPGQGPDSGTAARPELRISKVMKVESTVFDDLLASVGDLFMALSSLKALSSTSRSIELKDGVHVLGKSVNRLHGNILEARMLPIADLTEGLPRVVRDISKRSGKEVDLKMEGTDLRLDRGILENLGAPLVHIIRNAVDHGLETPDERKDSGKLPRGTIYIKARPKKDHVVMTVTDDGRGVDVARVREKAVEKGISPEKVNAMSDKEAMMLVCMPGLSSAERVTDTSGRGVGMDVVRDSIEGIGGKLSIESVKDRGTRITLELPRTTSIIKALSVTVSGEQFLIPMSGIEKVVELHRNEIFGDSIFVEGVEVPVMNLAALIGLDEGEPGDTVTIIVVEARAPGRAGPSGPGAGPADGGERVLMGFLVDDFGTELDAFIRPLKPPISRLWGVSGITVMGDGRAVFLLDLAQITARPAR